MTPLLVYLCGYGALLWQAQFAWLMNMNARVECAYKPMPDAMEQWSVMMAQMKLAVLAKGTNSSVGTVLV